MSNPNYDALLTTTFRNVSGVIGDEVTDRLPLLRKLKDGGSYESVDGGAYLNVGIRHDNTGGQGGSYEGFDTMSFSPYEGLTEAEFDWKQAYTPVYHSGAEAAKNKGSQTRIANLVQEKVAQSRDELETIIQTALWGDGTGNSGKDLTGLDILVEDATGSAWSTVGGIDSSTATWWQNQFVDFSPNTETFFDTADNGIEYRGRAIFRTVWNDCMFLNRTPDLIITDQTVYEALEAMLEEERQNVKTDEQMAKWGFTNFIFKGTPVIWDPYCPAGNAFFLNTEFLHFKYHEDRNFVMTPWDRPVGPTGAKDARVAFFLFMGNLLTSSRQSQGRVVGIDV